MYSESDTLRHRRISYLLPYARNFFIASALLSVFCASICSFLLHSNGGLSGLLIALFSIFGATSVSYSQKRLARDPLWSPVMWYFALLLGTGVMWGLYARNGGYPLTAAVVLSGVASMALHTHGRLMASVMAPIAVIPLPFLFFNETLLLFQVHIPLSLMLVAAGYYRHKLGVRNIRSEFESRRLSQVMSEVQADLQAKVEQRTAELEEANKRLNLEVDLRRDVNQALIQSEEQLNLAMTTSGIGFWDWDISNRKVYHSHPERFFDNDEKTVEDDFDLFQRVFPSDLTAIRKAMVMQLKGQSEYYQARYRIQANNNVGIRWLEDIGKVTDRNERGIATRMVGTRRDISKDMQVQEELILAASLFNNNPDGVFILDSQQQFKTCNRAFCEIFQRQKGELIGLPLFQVLHTDQSHRISQSMVSNGRWHGDIIATRSGAERFPITLTLTTIKRDDDSVSHYLGICRDQSESQQAQSELRFLNTYDKLTGLFNRAYFHKVLQQFAEHRPLAANHYAVCVINVDRFKTINESLGLEVGDQLLKDLAARLTNFREPVRQVSRLNSDEFAMVIEFDNNEAHLQTMLKDLQDEITRPFLIDVHELIITASIGVCIVSEHNLGQQLNHAIAAMNQARYRGGNNFQFYHQRLASSPLEKLQMEKALRKAIVQQEFSVDYQPKLNLHTGIIDSVEALVRWRHPHKGLLDPQDFIPLAEETGLISAIGEQVLNKACIEAATWRKRGFGDISVSVNLSSHQIRQDDLFDVVHNALRNSELPAEYLELELTESMLMEDINHAHDFLNQLRSLGVRLALDDFGTGYSSLSYLKRLPIDTLKIDQSFVAEARNGKPSPIVEAIMAMADSLRLNVVAEGVETHEQLAYLKSLNCDYAQGYIISRALPASEVLTLIRHANMHTLTQSSTSLH